ncbi:MAG: hypothetical protein IPL79_11785 [Myxococcales bacterium]|nr:hypothetical protein [Myxococcales bacterium]
MADADSHANANERAPLVDVLADAGLVTSGPHAAAALAAIGAAVQQARGFPQGFWHPEEVDDAIDTMRACLDDLELESAFVEKAQAELAAATTQWLEEHDEEDARRLQITAVMAMANARLLAVASPLAFVEFDEPVPGWESDEPVWVLVSAEERAWLATLGWREVVSQ